MEKSKIKLTQKDAKNSPAGGVVVGKRNGQTMIYDDASVGGYFVGKTHDEGGIKMVNKSNGQPLEVQGSEVIITAPAVADQTKRNFDGKMMTNREILSTINERGGGVAFAEKGMEIPKKIKRTGASYKYGGKTMTDHEIYKYITGGGIAEDFSIRDIANIHQVPLSELKEEVRIGMLAESEHKADKKEQMEIVKDHLFENPKYYTVLKKAGLENGGYFTKDKNYEIGGVFHGSPYLFDEFTTERMGTGSGKQIDGWGIYLTDSKDSSKIYGRNIYETTLFKGKDINEYTFIDLDKPVQKDVVRKVLKAVYQKYNKDFDINKFNEYYDYIKEKSLQKVDFNDYELIYFDYSGFLFYKTLSRILGGDKKASLFLLDNRIDGLKRNISKTRIDYIIFDADDITIDKKESFAKGGQTESLVKDAKSGNTPARDLNNYNDVLDIDADGMVGAETGLYAYGGRVSNSKLFMPSVRGGWTKEKIIRYQKSHSSDTTSTLTLLKYISEFADWEEFKNHIYYHGTQSYIEKGLKPSITMSEREVERIGGGGYGQRYFGVSLTKRKRTAESFSGMSDGVTIYPVILKRDAKVIERTDLQDASEIEDIIVELYDKGVDAVYIGGGEEELVVVNPFSILLYKNGREYHSVFGGFKSVPLTDEKIKEIYNNSKILSDKYIEEYNSKQNKEERNEFTNSIPNIQFENGGLIAPNGHKTNLTPEQYKLVRTPEFKEWFGDWENDIANSSKVVDSNGEPMVVYHTTSAEFNIFSKNKSKEGFFFSPNKERLEVYNKSKVDSYFLRIVNPSHEMFKTNLEYLKGKMYDGIMDYGHARKINEYLYEIIAFEPNQIKLADGTNTKFDNMNPDIRYDDGGMISNYIKKTYGNLVEKQGLLTTQTQWLNKDGVKVLEYGFDPYRNEEDNTLFYYSWDFRDSKMEYDDFREQLVDFFKKTYNKDVNELKSLYVGWNRKEKNTYAEGGITLYDANMEGDTTDMMFADGGSVQKSKDANVFSSKVFEWDKVPSNYKNIKKVKKVTYINNPLDKGLDEIIRPFLGNDDLRPSMTGVNFDDNGITATNAHILITLPYPNKKYDGIYDINKVKKEKSNELVLINDNYPKYENIIPKWEDAGKPYLVDVYKLLQYTKTALNYANKTTYAIAYKFGDNETIGFNGKFLITTLTAILKLGHEKIYVFISKSNRAIILSPNPEYELGNDEIILTMPVMISSKYGTNIDFYGTGDIDYGSEIRVYFDFNDSEIHNADGSVAEFKMEYQSNTAVDDSYLSLLSKITKKRKGIAILDNVKVYDGRMVATDLEIELVVKNVNMPNGIYQILNNAPTITMEAIEDFPRQRVYDKNEYHTRGNVFNKNNETPNEKIYTAFEFTMSSDVFEFYLDKLLLSVGDDDLRPVLSGICIHKTSENNLFLVGTNAHTICVINITEYCDFTKDDRELKYILPVYLLKDFAKLTEGALHIKCNMTNIFIESENIDYVARAIDGNYPNYQAVIPKNQTNKIVFDYVSMNNCIKSQKFKDLIAKHKGDKNIQFTITNSGNKLYLRAFKLKGYRIDNQSELVDEIELCDINFNYSKEENIISNTDSLFLMMPVFNDIPKNNQYFNFGKDLFEVMLNTITDIEVECFYSELNMGYVFPIDAIDFKKTTKPEKTKQQKLSKKDIEEIIEMQDLEEELAPLVENQPAEEKEIIKLGDNFALEITKAYYTDGKFNYIANLLYKNYTFKYFAGGLNMTREKAIQNVYKYIQTLTVSEKITEDKQLVGDEGKPKKVMPIYKVFYNDRGGEHLRTENTRKEIEEFIDDVKYLQTEKYKLSGKKYVIESKGFTQGVGSSANKIKRKKELDDLKNKIEIQEAIETLEMLLETATRKDKKEIKEAIEVLQMLLDTYEY